MMEEEEEEEEEVVVVAAAAAGNREEWHLGSPERGGDERHAGPGYQRTSDSTDHKQCPVGNRGGMLGSGEREGWNARGGREGVLEILAHAGAWCEARGRVGGC